MNCVDLSGKWDAFLDESKSEKVPEKFTDEIFLPNTTSNARLGKRNPEKNYGCLTDLYKFEGFAWFRRKIIVTREQARQKLLLFLERTRKTAVFIDGVKIGEFCSLVSPHRCLLDGISEGEHELLIRVDNTDYPTKGGHLTSPDTQTNWNGITGRIELICCSALPENIRILSDIARKTVTVKADIFGEKSGVATLKIFDDNTVYGEQTVEFTNALDCVINVSENTPEWSEFSPNLLNLEIKIGDDVKTVKFGFREFKANGLRFEINGRQTFLRGKHDALVFPKTGFAPTDFDSWLSVFKTALDYGINHYRFHTCCPPEAAFDAADALGIYLQPELPFWGTIPDEPDAEFLFLREEGFRMLREFGRHPSFVMMSMGNELWGSHERLNELLGEFKRDFPDKLYTQGSNNFQFVPCVLENDDFFSGVRFSRERLIRGSYGACDKPFGHVQTDCPNSVHNYDKEFAAEAVSAGENGGEIMIQYGTEMKKVQSEDGEVLIPKVPVVTHEIGQYVTYPDYREIALYNGSLRHDTYEKYRETAEKKGLLPYAERFFKASGALAVDCYRRELETVLRSGKIAGFQLLDLQDFPGQGTATVGVLNAFMESKGLISTEDWRRFCGETVVLAELEKFVFTSGEKIACGLLVSSTAPNCKIREISWHVSLDGETLAEGKSALGAFNGRIARAENVRFSISCSEAKTALLELNAGGFVNQYTLYVYPEINVEITENSIKYDGKELPIVHDKPQKNALCIPYPKDGDLCGEYCTDFWCYGMFKSISESMGRSIPTGTLGLLIDQKSALLSGFPSESHTAPPWYNIVMHSFSANLDGTEIVPDVWVIDNPERAHRLGLLYRNGGVVCTSRLWEIADKIEVKHFAASLADAILKEENL